MLFSTTTAAVLTALFSLALSAPAGSKHTIYLATCAPDDCPIGICDPDDYNIRAAAYFSNGPPTSSSSSATTVGAVSSSYSNSWEGKKTTRIGTAGSFSSNITSKTAPNKGDIAGDGTLTGGGLLGIGASSEPFVCFKDGSTKFKVTYETDRYTCTAEYYCPSIDVGASPA